MAKNPQKAKKEPFTVRFDPELLRKLDKFCLRAQRDRNDVVRAAVEILLAGGELTAERILSRGLLDDASDAEILAGLDHDLSKISGLPPKTKDVYAGMLEAHVGKLRRKNRPAAG